MTVTVEACVTTLDEAVASVEAGADRLELCADLEVGGLTPPVELVRAVVEAVDVPVLVMVRPRAGDFVVTRADVDTMERSADALLEAGAHGIVCGALTPAGQVDFEAVRALAGAAGGRDVTFHRAIDEVLGSRTPQSAPYGELLCGLADAGVTRILTGGGPGRAIDQTASLRRLRSEAPNGLTVLAAGGIRSDHARSLVGRTGVGEVHARALAIPDLVRALR